MIFEIFEIVVTSSVLIAGIFILRRLSRGRISMRLRYMLWLLVAVRLLLPVSLGTSPLSVMNLLPGVSGTGGETDRTDGVSKTETAGTALYDAHVPEEPQEGGQGEVPAVYQNPEEDMGRSKLPFAKSGEGIPVQGADAAFLREKFPAASALGILWLLGFLAAGGYMLVMRFRFLRWLSGHRQQLSEERVPECFVGRFAKRGIKVYLVKKLPSPCLVGRRIYVGESMLSDGQRFSHILAHEYCHAVHGDAFWAFLRCALAAFYWFDPFVWAAAFAARQDSELACDEAAVRLLGEEQRFSYGRTLLSLLENGRGGEGCPGMAFMSEGGEQKVRERIFSLTKEVKTKKATLAAVLVVMVLFCGCAFTGAGQNGEDSAGQPGSRTGGTETADGKTDTDGQKQPMDDAEKKEEAARIQEEYDEAQRQIDDTQRQIDEAGESVEQTVEQTAGQAAFEEVLNYHGIMEGRDDGELAKNRKLDIQAYYDYLYQINSGAQENPLENGWYLLSDYEEAGISVYGLYTEEFGFRGIKMLNGGDVNTWDIKWCPSYFNFDMEKTNIRVLERDSDGLVRSFVWKILEEETSGTEIWRLYSGYRYDTGTIDLKAFGQEECLAWAGQHLSFSVDQEAGRVSVAYDGETIPGSFDISAYENYEVEDVQISTEVIGFDLDGNAFGEQIYDDYDGVVVNLAVGLKVKGSDEIWVDGLSPLAVQVVQDEDGNFKLQQPTIDGTRWMHNLHQQRQRGEDF